MKKLAILFSILVLALFIAPGLIGFKAQSEYQEIISGMQQAGIEVTGSDYQRGWFGSQAETEFKLNLPPDAAAAELKISMHSDIVHGPLSPDGGLALASIGTYFKTDGKALFPEEENKILNTRIGMDGNGKTLITIPALKFVGEPGRPEIQLSGADGELVFDTGFTQLDIDLTIPELWLGGADGESFRVTGVTLGSKFKAGTSGLRLGNGKLGIKQIDFVNPKNGVAVKIDAINLYGDTREDGDNLAFTANYSIDAIAVNDAGYGPAEISLEFENIPATVAARLQKGIREVRSKKLSQEQQGMAMMSLLMGAGPELLKANPRLAIKRLFVKTPDGDIEGSLSIASDGLLWSEIDNIQSILKKLNADASIRLPEKLLRPLLEAQAKQSIIQHIEMRNKMGESVDMPSAEEIQTLGQDLVEQRLGDLLQQGVLVRDGTYLSSAAKLGGGLLSVNGKTIPLYLGR